MISKQYFSLFLLCGFILGLSACKHSDMTQHDAPNYFVDKFGIGYEGILPSPIRHIGEPDEVDPNCIPNNNTAICAFASIYACYGWERRFYKNINREACIAAGLDPLAIFWEIYEAEKTKLNIPYKINNIIYIDNPTLEHIERMRFISNLEGATGYEDLHIHDINGIAMVEISKIYETRKFVNLYYIIKHKNNQWRVGVWETKKYSMIKIMD